MNNTAPPESQQTTRFKKMKSFDIPQLYQSSFIGNIKEIRRQKDKLKRDFSPTLLDFGPVKFLISRHFGFCYGVENAVEIAYKALLENPSKRIFLLSEMIHNPDVNQDLISRGVSFIMETSGQQIIPWAELNANDIVIVPAFGTTLEIQQQLTSIGINAYQYNTTCPFVEKVWNRAATIGQKSYTIVIHGKPSHEETRATFSHAKDQAPTVVLRNMQEAQALASYLTGQKDQASFETEFEGQFSEGFNIATDLQRIGVVNQTTMLASDTQSIANYLQSIIITHFKPIVVRDRFADTRDTLCYATNDNQSATHGLLKQGADLAIVAGGYNSSNTSHLVQLCEAKLPTYFIESEAKIIDKNLIYHYDFHNKEEIITTNFLPLNRPLTVMLTCGASCPDAVVEGILDKILSFYKNTRSKEEILEGLQE